MAIIIKKKDAPQLRDAAPLVDEPKQNEPWSPKNSVDWWTKHGLSPNAQLKKCGWCGHLYYKPCSEEPVADKCINYGWLRTKMQAQGKAP